MQYCFGSNNKSTLKFSGASGYSSGKKSETNCNPEAPNSGNGEKEEDECWDSVLGFRTDVTAVRFAEAKEVHTKGGSAPIRRVDHSGKIVEGWGE